MSVDNDIIKGHTDEEIDLYPVLQLVVLVVLEFSIYFLIIVLRMSCNDNSVLDVIGQVPMLITVRDPRLGFCVLGFAWLLTDCFHITLIKRKIIRHIKYPSKKRE